MYTTTPEVIVQSVDSTPEPIIIIVSSNPAAANAQATIDTGQSQLLELARQSTQVSLNMSQAANSAAQATQAFNQQQKLALDFQANGIRLNMERAAATQEFLKQQTKTARDAAAAAQRSTQSRADAAAESAFLVVGSQTAQAQATMAAQGSQTAEAVAVLTSSPLTATPYAATQAALLMNEYGREQRSFVNQIVNPLLPFIVVLDLLLFILGIILIYRRYVLIPWPRRLRFATVIVNPNPLTIIDGGFAEHDQGLDRVIPSELRPASLTDLPGENTTFVEIVNAAELPIADWIAEVEGQLTADGRLSL